MSVLRLRLRHVSFATVEFDLVQDGRVLRPVVVRVGSGPDWYRAVNFPTIGSEGSTSTGDPALDEQVREEAGKELLRLAAAVEALRAGRVA